MAKNATSDLHRRQRRLRDFSDQVPRPAVLAGTGRAVQHHSDPGPLIPMLVSVGDGRQCSLDELDIRLRCAAGGRNRPCLRSEGRLFRGYLQRFDSLGQVGLGGAVVADDLGQLRRGFQVPTARPAEWMDGCFRRRVRVNQRACEATRVLQSGVVGCFSCRLAEPPMKMQLCEDLAGLRVDPFATGLHNDRRGPEQSLETFARPLAGRHR